MKCQIIFIIVIIAVFVADGYETGVHQRNTSIPGSRGPSRNHIGKSISYTGPIRNERSPVMSRNKIGSVRCNQPNYRLTMDNRRCEPVCRSCEHGECIAPNQCRCNKGYLKNRATNTCNPHCQISCVKARCTAPDYCECYPGFVPLNRNTCRPARCSCNDHGLCLADNYCSKCNSGYFMSTVQGVIRCMPYCQNSCPNDICIFPGNCSCNRGYHWNKVTGGCDPVCNKGCVNGFTCVAPNWCGCRGTIKNITVIGGNFTTVQQECVSRGSVLSDMGSAILLIFVAILYNSYYLIN